MSIVDNILVAPIGLAEAYEYVGLAPTNKIYDVVDLCTCSLINKWAKNKPIRYPSFKVLTDKERAGDFVAHSEGVYYGLKLSNTAGRIDTLHNATFEYQRVREGIDWSRLSDFDGYDKNARPNPVGAVDDYIYIDLHPAHGGCSITYSELNTTGVNIADAIWAMDEANKLGDYYPCVLVTIDNTMYARALWNMAYSFDNLNSTSTSEVGFTTMQGQAYVSGTDTMSRPWYNDWAILLGGLPNATEGKELTVTVFFTKSIGMEGNAAVPNLKKWLAVDNMISSGVCFACPDAVAKKVLLKRFYTKALEVTGGLWSMTANKLIVSVATAWVEPVVGTTYTLRGTLYTSDREVVGSVSTNVTYTGNNAPLAFDMDVNTSLLIIPTTTVFTFEWEVVNTANTTIIHNSGETQIAHR